METWLPCVGIPEYSVSSCGAVRSIYTNRPLVGGLDKDGYRKIVMCSGGRRLHRRFSVLVCEAFHGERPDGLVVRHGNGIRTDDRADNLSWCTQKENIADKETHGTSQRGERSGVAKLTEAQALRIRDGGEHYALLRAELGISKSTVYAIRSGRNWSHLATATPSAAR